MIFSITAFIYLHSKVSHTTVVTKYLAKIITLFLQWYRSYLLMTARQLTGLCVGFETFWYNIYWCWTSNLHHSISKSVGITNTLSPAREIPRCVCLWLYHSLLSLPCVATANPRARRSTESTVAPPTQTTTSPECGSIPSLVYQQGRDGIDGHDWLQGPVGPSGTKGEKGDPGIVVQVATGSKGMYMYVLSSLLNLISWTTHSLCWTL